MKDQRWARPGSMNGHYKHGKRKTRLFRIWSNMKTRCYNPNFHSYRYYGARGITVCDEWLSDFMNFFSWAILNGYRDDLTLDRIDNNGNYSPENCRWATTGQQSCNRSSNHYVTLNGTRRTLKEWCDVFGMNYHTVQDRLRRGWTYSAALTTQPDRRWSGSHGR